MTRSLNCWKFDITHSFLHWVGGAVSLWSRNCQ